VLLQKMMPAATELVLGAIRDKLFGPVVMFGLGGVYVEVLKRVGFRLAPFGIEQARALWDIRHAIPDMQGFEGGSIKHDVSVPVDAVPELIARGIERVTAMMPGIRPVPFGHVGDGNIHFNFSQPVDMDKAAFLNRWEEVNAGVHQIVADLGGSISAEHGIGQLKRALLPEFKGAVELELMRKIKATLDPKGILNPGKMFD